MLGNYSLLFKWFLTIFIIISSILFFYFGYISLNLNKLYDSDTSKKSIKIENEKNKQNVILENNFKKETNDTKNSSKSQINNYFLENETIIRVKKNDTFGKIIDPYFHDDRIKSKIIHIFKFFYLCLELIFGFKK